MPLDLCFLGVDFLWQGCRAMELLPVSVCWVEFSMWDNSGQLKINWISDPGESQLGLGWKGPFLSSLGVLWDHLGVLQGGWIPGLLILTDAMLCLPLCRRSDQADRCEGFLPVLVAHLYHLCLLLRCSFPFHWPWEVSATHSSSHSLGIWASL